MEKYYYRRIIFSKSQLKSGVKIGESCHIYPCNYSGAPQHDKAEHFPLILEYYLNVEKEIVELIDFEKKLLCFLSSVINTLFFDYSLETFWGIPLDSANEYSRSIMFMKSYWYPDVKTNMMIEEFTPINRDDSIFENHKTYYTHIGEEDTNGNLKLPVKIEELVNTYFSLTGNPKKIVDRACNLMSNGIELFATKPSIALVSLISGVETIIGFEYKKVRIEHCKECKTPKYQISKKFKDFLETYISQNPNSVEKYGKIYSVRSKIIHSGKLLLSDDEFGFGIKISSDGSIELSETSEAKEQKELLYNVRQLARLVLHNWLLSSPKLK